MNFKNQELICHIHCLGCIFYDQSLIKNFVDFLVSYFMIFTLDSIHRMAQTITIQQNILVFTSAFS